MSSQDGEKPEIAHLEGSTALASLGGSVQDTDEEPELHCACLISSMPPLNPTT